MNATPEAVENAMVERVIQKASAAQRRYLIEKLLPRLLEETEYMPQPVVNERGETVGVFVPNFRSDNTNLPEMSVEFQAEMRRRLQSPENSSDVNGFLKLVDLEEARQSK